MTHYPEEIRFLHSGQQGREMRGEGLPHLWWQYRERVQGDQAVTFEGPGPRRADLDEHENAKEHSGSIRTPHGG